MTRIVCFASVLITCLLTACHGRLVEEERLEEYHKRGYTWPPKYVPDTDGWRRLMERRFAQVEHITSRGEKYDGWVETATAAYTLKNFTESGWGLTRAPKELVETLREAVRTGLPNAGVEGDVDVIIGEPPLFIKRPELMRRVLHELQPIHEAWSHEKMVPFTAYGFRLYKNNSRLLMHIDKTSTHIISCILHVDSSDDAQPWPIVIEDFQGNTNEVILTPGDMLLYESGKCFHGRPHAFNGSWYTSVFVHYFPSSEEWAASDHDIEGHYGVPPHWYREPTAEPKYPRLEMRGTSMKEPECEPDHWCALADTDKWSGPGEEDYVLTTNRRYPLYEDEAKKEL